MKSIIPFVLFAFVLSGCSAKNILLPEAENIRIYEDLPAALECQYKGEVIASEATLLTYLFISNHDITMGARNDLRNKAAKIGGNTIVIEPNNFVYVTSTVYVGQVFNCSENK